MTTLSGKTRTKYGIFWTKCHSVSLNIRKRLSLHPAWFKNNAQVTEKFQCQSLHLRHAAVGMCPSHVLPVTFEKCATQMSDLFITKIFNKRVFIHFISIEVNWFQIYEIRIIIPKAQMLDILITKIFLKKVFIQFISTEVNWIESCVSYHAKGLSMQNYISFSLHI